MERIIFYYYKGYFATVKITESSTTKPPGKYEGKIHIMDNSFDFSGEGLALEKFHIIIDKYLTQCEQEGIKPKPGICMQQIINLKSTNQLSIVLSSEIENGIEKYWSWSIKPTYEDSIPSNHWINFGGRCKLYVDAVKEAMTCWADIKSPLMVKSQDNNVNLKELNLNTAVKNCLNRFFNENPNITCLQEISKEQLMEIRHFGKARLQQLIEALEQNGIDADWLK